MGALVKDFVHRQCPVCGNLEPALMRWADSVNGIQRIFCESCSSIYFDQDPPEWPSYDLKYNSFFFRPGDIRKAGIMAATLAELAQATWKNPNILEAGSGNGLTIFLLRAMGLCASGVDLDPKLSEYLLTAFKIPVTAIRFEEYNPPWQFHLVYSSHVIEHTQNPFAFMQRAYDLLHDNGIFYLDTPDSFYYNKEGKRWHHFETRNPYEHCCLLGAAGIHYLARKAGFQVVKLTRFPEYMSQQVILLK